ncbi:hypothetical protein MVEN_02122100 [Mycena venus]|uniref:Uncharacterized protein n=1 Tax=Mycena venus TaxID=2733690 RepID=A0A8H6X917_9AGAR|nr:hypothetical protein MVEN_02122100 [Mycena venus]
MDSSHALIRRNPDAVVAVIQENSSERGKWALVLSPGRTLNQVYTILGNVLEKPANRTAHKLGLGPRAVTQKIKSYFGSGEKRVRQLELLQGRTLPSLSKLEKHCFKLLKYTSPAESAQTQCRAFQNIVDLVTLLPGLRELFLRTQFLDGAMSTKDISVLWARHDNAATNAEWEFWNNFAATCLSLSNIAMMLKELSIRELTICDEQGLSVIERLLIERDGCGDLPYPRALCIRYLAGIVDLPGFWLNMGVVHSHVASKLCREMVLVLKDIGVDILALGLIDASEPESLFDYEGVDFLAITLLAGISTWFDKLDPEDWSAQPWYESFTTVLLLLRRPRAAELLPRSSSCAASDFENILPSVYQDAELNLRVVNR